MRPVFPVAPDRIPGVLSGHDTDRTRPGSCRYEGAPSQRPEAPEDRAVSLGDGLCWLGHRPRSIPRPAGGRLVGSGLTYGWPPTPAAGSRSGVRGRRLLGRRA